LNFEISVGQSKIRGVIIDVMSTGKRFKKKTGGL
jgi:hypothetical protein